MKQTSGAARLPRPFGLVTDCGGDSAGIPKSDGGVPTVNLVVPVHDIHAHNGIANRRDFERTADPRLRALNGHAPCYTRKAS